MSEFLKNLFDLLLKLSPDEFSHRDVFGDAEYMDVSNRWFRTRIRFSEIASLSDFLFQQLQTQFELLPSVSSVPSRANSDIEALDDDEFILLLRCCVLMVNFLEFDQSLVLEKCQVILSILDKLSRRDLLVYHRRNSSREKAGIGMEFGNMVLQKCRILEVFIDQFVMHQELRKHLVITDYVSDPPEKLFEFHCDYGDFNVVLEVVSFHFLLSSSDKTALKMFTHYLSWSKGNSPEITELCLKAALVLLSIPAMFSAPCMLQAHLILLASKCIGMQMLKDDKELDVAAFSLYVSAFELSTNVYASCISALGFSDLAKWDNVGMGCVTEPSFQSCVRTSTYGRVNLHIQNLVDFCEMQFSCVLSRSKTEFLNDCISYIKENQRVVDESIRERACSILNHLMSHALTVEFEMNTSLNKKEGILQEIICLAAVLKLMSLSLLKIMWFLKQNEYLAGWKAPRDNSCRGYDFLLGLLSSFGRYYSCNNVKQILLSEVESDAGELNRIKMMLVHFASLALYSFNEGLDFLWKGSIFMMMTTMNLLSFGDGKLDAFKPLLHIQVTSTTESLEDMNRQSSSIKIASNMQNIQKLVVRDRVNPSSSQDQWTGPIESNKIEKKDALAGIVLGMPSERKHGLRTDDVDICDGRIFMESLLTYKMNRTEEWDDLVDFIECKNGRNYSSWLNKREAFRKWKIKKTATGKRKSRKKKARRNFLRCIA